MRASTYIAGAICIASIAGVVALLIGGHSDGWGWLLVLAFLALGGVI